MCADDGSGSANLGNATDRERLSGPGFAAFVAAVQFLHLNSSEAQKLLGDMPSARYERYAMLGAPTLEQDVLERMSLVFGIIAALRTLFVDDDTARRWLHSANASALFGGGSPKDHMLQGSITHLGEVRTYLRAWQQGWP